MYEFIKAKEIENIFLEHVINRKKIEDKSKELIKHAFEQIISRILLQIKLYIENSNQFKLAERSYDKRTRLREQYMAYLELSCDNNLLMKEDLDVIKGIFLLIKQEIENFPQSDDNPLEYERMLIVSTGLLKIKETLNTIQDSLINGFQLPKGLSIDVASTIREFIIDSYQEVEANIITSVTQVVNLLNEPNEREEIKRYLHFLDTQEAMLKNFIYFNFDIDKEWQAKHGNIEMNQVYIYPLKQLFHEIHTTITDINYSFNKKINIDPIVIKNIENIVETNVMKNRRLKELIELVEEDKTNSIDRLLAHVSDEMRKISALELKRLKKESSSAELQSYMIVDLFSKLLHLIEKQDLSSIESDVESSILKAVITTLTYKYQALKQKDNEFHMKKLDFYLECENDYLEFRDFFEKKIQLIVEDILQDDSASLKTTQSKFNYMIEKSVEKNKRLDVEYFSKEVLFEIRTFEDLMKQSVVRLEPSEAGVVVLCVEEVTKLYKRILHSLELININQFLPEIGETFNGKFHEVLMVEVVEEYKKGDIVRVQNSGFMQQEQVLLRASVIVAK